MQKKPLGHDAIQQKVFEYIWNNYPQARKCFWHTPNEMIADNFIERSIIATKTPCPAWIRKIIIEYKKRFIMKLSVRQSIGVLKGVTDLVFYWAGTLYMFDIKIGTDKLSDAQKEFITANEIQGGQFFEIPSLEIGIQIIDNIFKNSVDLTKYIPYFNNMYIGKRLIVNNAQDPEQLVKAAKKCIDLGYPILFSDDYSEIIRIEPYEPFISK